MDLMDEYEPLPETSWVRTPSLGQHLYFAWPEGEPPLPHVVGWLPGVDVPWQVAVPPSAKLEMFKDSRIKNDRAVPIYLPYEWGQVINPLPVAPAWLLEDIRTRPRQTQGGQARGGTYGHSASELPATELFLERGLGWFTGSRDFDCFKLGRRLWGQYGDEATVVAFIYEAWKRTPPKITRSAGRTRITRSSKRNDTGAPTSRRASD
jgi:hypothetical protein